MQVQRFMGRVLWWFRRLVSQGAFRRRAGCWWQLAVYLAEVLWFTADKAVRRRSVQQCLGFSLPSLVFSVVQLAEGGGAWMCAAAAAGLDVEESLSAGDNGCVFMEGWLLIGCWWCNWC